VGITRTVKSAESLFLRFVLSVNIYPMSLKDAQEEVLKDKFFFSTLSVRRP